MMEKWVGVFVLISSALVLIVLMMKHNKYRISLKKITIHWIIAAFILFLLHTNELTGGFAVPMTPLSLSTIAVLGLPGLALVQGIYILI